MITIEDRPAAIAGSAAPSRVIPGAAFPRVGAVSDLAATHGDSGLAVTLSTRMHCRKPMKLVDSTEARIGSYMTIGAVSTLDSTGLVPEPATYRCDCGFTMDAPAVSGRAIQAA